MTMELNETTFAEQVTNSKGVVVVDFFTTWCPPCRALAPILEELEHATVLKVDGDKCQGLVVDNNVSAYPTLVFYKDGKEYARQVGLTPPQKLQSIIDRADG